MTRPRVHPSPEARAVEIDAGATSPARASRSLVAHAAIHLDVAWRDLPGTSWDTEVSKAQGRPVPARETVCTRIREVWLHALDLDHGGSPWDFPSDLLDALLADVLRAWQGRNEQVALVLAPAGREPTVLGDGGPTVPGTLPDVVCWLTGRGSVGVTSDEGDVPAMPRWL